MHNRVSTVLDFGNLIYVVCSRKGRAEFCIFGAPGKLPSSAFLEPLFCIAGAQTG